MPELYIEETDDAQDGNNRNKKKRGVNKRKKINKV